MRRFKIGGFRPSEARQRNIFTGKHCATEIDLDDLAAVVVVANGRAKVIFPGQYGPYLQVGGHSQEEPIKEAPLLLYSLIADKSLLLLLQRLPHDPSTLEDPSSQHMRYLAPCRMAMTVRICPSKYLDEALCSRMLPLLRLLGLSI